MGSVGEDYHRQQRQKVQDQRQLPISIPGFQFAPTDEELISFFLKRRLACDSSSPSADGLIAEFDIYTCNPWELPRHMFNYPRGQREMYFFTPTHPPPNSNGQGKRCGRTAGCGVWHGNGKDNLIKTWDDSKGRLVVIGHKTSFKFERIVGAAAASSPYQTGSSKKSSRIKTDWLMHEYRLQSIRGGNAADRRGLVLCKIYEKNNNSGKANGPWEHEAEGDQEDDRLLLQHQPLLKRKRAFQEPQERVPEARLLADAAEPLSPDTPFMICWEDQEPKEYDLVEEDQRPVLKRRRVVQQEHVYMGMMADNHEMGSRCGVCDTSSAADQSSCGGIGPLSASSADDVFALEDLLSIDDLPSLLQPPSSAPDAEAPQASSQLMTEVDPLQYWADLTEDWCFEPEETPLGSVPLLDDLFPQDVHAMLPPGV